MVRQFRAVGTFAILWGVAWAPVGVLTGIRHLLLRDVPFDRTLPLFLALGAVFTFVLGAVAGAAFSVVLLIAARGRPITDLPTHWVTLVVAAVGFGLGAVIEPGYVAAVLFAVLGGGTALGSLTLARRSRPASEQPS